MKFWESSASHVVRAVTKLPYLSLLLILFVMVLMSLPVSRLAIDASPDSLLLENDPDLKFYRAIHDEYGTDVYMVVAVRLNDSIFATSSIKKIEDITQQFRNIEDVSNVTSITTVPLIYQSLDEKEETEINFPTLMSKGVDINEAEVEFLTNPLYERNIVSEDLKIAAFKIDFQEKPEYKELFDQRYLLIEKREISELSRKERQNFVSINKRLEHLRKIDNKRIETALKEIRNILDANKKTLESYISGAPLIAHDMKHYVLQDIKVFGIAAILTMAIILFIIFHSVSWVGITLFSSFVNVLVVSGLIGLLGFKLTVVSSNYVAILLIFSLAIGIHVVVRYQEEDVSQGTADFHERLCIAIQHISTPCLFMVLTSTIAFLSLIISDIKPVIVFGYIMVIGLCGAYIVSFTILPLLIQLLKPKSKPIHKHYSHNVLDKSLSLILTNKVIVITILIICLAISGFGITNLTVENRFIDYFKQTTDIHRGLALIDQELGGTVPIEIILDAPVESDENGQDEDGLDEFDDYLSELDEISEGFTSQSYWYNRRGIEKIRLIHSHLENIPQIGKVLSLSSTEDIFKHIIREKELEDFQLSLIYSKLPENTMSILISPYLSQVGDQARIVARIKDSDHSLVRNDLLKKLNEDMKNTFSEKAGINVRVTGIGVLYNNVLQSLFRSQILTLGLVFISIFLVLSVLFNNIKFAFIAILPNIFTAILILGMMGVFNIPLNIMTITIAAITIGIGVDDAIHYIHRFKKELKSGKNIYDSIIASQLTVGKALWFTSITIASGFVLLVFSNFTPSIYFGLFTCLAMLISIFATFSIIPLLLSVMNPVKI
jgi:predicted RND superfamily exporter protein